MAITGPEPILDALRLRLENDLNQFIDVVNSDVTDGVTIDYVQQVLDFVPPRNLLTVYPTIGMAEGTFHLEDDTGWGATGRLPITVIIYLQEYDPAQLAKKLRRLERAVTMCVLQDRRLPPEGWGVIFVRADPGPTLSRNEDPREYMSYRTTTIEVRFEQDTEA